MYEQKPNFQCATLAMEIRFEFWQGIHLFVKLNLDLAIIEVE